MQLDDYRRSIHFELGHIARPSTAAWFLGILRRFRGDEGAVQEGENDPR